MPHLKITQVHEDEFLNGELDVQGTVDLAIAKQFVDVMKCIGGPGFWDRYDVLQPFFKDNPILHVLEGMFSTEGSPSTEYFEGQIASTWECIMNEGVYCGLNDVSSVHICLVQ